MKRMAPLLVILVLVLAPAAWGYNVTLTSAAIGIQAKATAGVTVIATPIELTEPGVYEGYSAQALSYNGSPIPGPADSASSEWVAKVYEPVVTWGPGGVGKTTSITQVINVSMLLKFVHPFLTASCGDFTTILTDFSAVREDLTTLPQVTLETSWSGTPGTSGPDVSTGFYKQMPGFPPPELPQYIIDQNNAPPALQTADAAGIAVLIANSDYFHLALDFTTSLVKTASNTVDPTDSTTWENFNSNLYLTETLNLIEPNMVDPDVIPVPPSLILLGSGLLGLGVLPRLRRRIKA